MVLMPIFCFYKYYVDDGLISVNEAIQLIHNTKLISKFKF